VIGHAHERGIARPGPVDHRGDDASSIYRPSPRGLHVGLRWQLGHAPGGRGGEGGLISHLRSRGHPDRLLVDAGLAFPGRSRGLVDLLRDRLAVPPRDTRGVVGFAGRRLHDRREGSPKWLNTATTALYRKGAHVFGLAEQSDLIASGRGRMVLVERPFDAIAVNLAGDVGLAAGGTARTEDHTAQLVAVTGPHRPLQAAYDAVPAGYASTVRAAQLFTGYPALQVLLPPARTRPTSSPPPGRADCVGPWTAPDHFSMPPLTTGSTNWAVHLAAGDVAAAVDAVRYVAPLINTAAPGQDADLVALTAARSGLTAGPGQRARPGRAQPGIARSLEWQRTEAAELLDRTRAEAAAEVAAVRAEHAEQLAIARAATERVLGELAGERAAAAAVDRAAHTEQTADLQRRLDEAGGRLRDAETAGARAAAERDGLSGQLDQARAELTAARDAAERPAREAVADLAAAHDEQTAAVAAAREQGRADGDQRYTAQLAVERAQAEGQLAVLQARLDAATALAADRAEQLRQLTGPLAAGPTTGRRPPRKSAGSGRRSAGADAASGVDPGSAGGGVDS
jgi:hypothetical protein